MGTSPILMAIVLIFIAGVSFSGTAYAINMNYAYKTAHVKPVNGNGISIAYNFIVSIRKVRTVIGKNKEIMAVDWDTGKEIEDGIPLISAKGTVETIAYEKNKKIKTAKLFIKACSKGCHFGL